eukprot:355292-Chlamydomonas_euryale.AAC.1
MFPESKHAATTTTPALELSYRILTSDLQTYALLGRCFYWLRLGDAGDGCDAALGATCAEAAAFGTSCSVAVDASYSAALDASCAAA